MQEHLFSFFVECDLLVSKVLVVLPLFDDQKLRIFEHYCSSRPSLSLVANYGLVNLKAPFAKKFTRL